MTSKEGNSDPIHGQPHQTQRCPGNMQHKPALSQRFVKFSSSRKDGMSSFLINENALFILRLI